jgi:hypothetical protein
MKLKLIAILIINLTAMVSCATQPAPAYHAKEKASYQTAETQIFK